MVDNEASVSGTLVAVNSLRRAAVLLAVLTTVAFMGVPAANADQDQVKPDRVKVDQGDRSVITLSNVWCC